MGQSFLSIFNKAGIGYFNGENFFLEILGSFPIQQNFRQSRNKERFRLSRCPTLQEQWAH